MQYIVLVSERYGEEQKAFGPYSDEQQAKDVQLLLQLGLALKRWRYKVSVLPLQQYEAKNLT